MNKLKVIIFIDGSNLYNNLVRSFDTAKIDFISFLDFLSKKNRLIKTYYYSVPLDIFVNQSSYQKQQKFFSFLRKIPSFETKLGRLEKRKNGHMVEKGVDVKMAVDIVTHAYSNIYDVGIIVSGDADFVPAIEAAQDFGKKIVNVSFPKAKSFHLNQICDETIFIGKNEFEKLNLK